METTEDMPVRSYVTFYIQVDDLQAALDKLSAMGGAGVMPPMEIAPRHGLHRPVPGSRPKHHRPVLASPRLGRR